MLLSLGDPPIIDMVLVGTLWGDARQRQSKVILSVAALNGFELEQPPWSYTHRPPAYTAKFRYGKIPTFEGTDGFRLTEGSTIARYLSSIGTRVDLLGASAQDAAVVDQWVHFAEHEVGTPCGNMTGLIYGYYGAFDREVLDQNGQRMARALAYLESHLAARPSGYVALDTLTLADFVVAGVINAASGAVLGAAERARYPSVFAHYAKVAADERVKQYWGTDGFVDVRITAPKPSIYL